MNKKFFNRIISIIVALVFVVSFPLYSFAIVGGTENKYSFTMEDVVDAYKNNDIKKLNEMAKELVQEENEEPSIVPLWSSDSKKPYDEEKMCHAFITVMGCFWYIGAVANDGYDVSKNGITVDDIEILSEYSEWPDTWDIGVVYDCHFYDPDTGKNYRGTSNTADKKFSKHYLDAINTANAEDSFKALGKALHFIQDINEPHHAANLTAGNSTHSEFEEYVSLNRDRLMEMIVVPVQVDKNVLKMDTGSIAYGSAKCSKAFASAANKPKEDADWDEVGSLTLMRSVYDTASVIYKFMKSTKRI